MGVAFSGSTCSRRTGACWKPRLQPTGWEERAGESQTSSWDVMEELASRGRSRTMEAAVTILFILGCRRPEAGSRVWWLHFKLS